MTQPAVELEPASLRGLHADMSLLRALDELAVDYHRQGRIGTHAIYWGHEAIQAGAVLALDDRDWIFPSYREAAIGLLRGISLETVLSWLRGELAGCWDPHAHGVANVCAPVATHIPHAVGFAWGSQMKGEDTCALVFFGDGATSEGSFHEGLTFAGVVGAPVVLICNNNGWALSTPLSAQTAAETLADKALGYGIPAERVDGGDVLAVHHATRTAIDRARAGEGPTFIEATTYRMAPHTTSDDPSLYLDDERVRRERANECLARFEQLLVQRGITSKLDAAAVHSDCISRIRAAMEAVEARGAESPARMLEIVYADPPRALQRARDSLAESHDVMA